MKIARAPSHVQFSKRLTDVPVGAGLDDLEELQDELLEYVDILLGRADPPIGSPYLDLQEVATAYLGRALEIDMLIHWQEQKEKIPRGHPLQRFRTGQLRSFIDMANRLADLGSRRLSQEQLLNEQRYDAGEGY